MNRVVERMTWLRPENLQQALTWLNEYHPRIVCGGTDIFVDWLRRKHEFTGVHWLDIRSLPELKETAFTSEGLEIGAAVTAAEIWQRQEFQAVSALQQAARVVGGWQIQNRASLGGNIANASPAADMVIPLVAYAAEVKLVSVHGERWVSITQFIQGPRQTLLRPEELITAIRIPNESLHHPSAFVRHDQRGATDISIVSAAVVFHGNADSIQWGRAAVGAAHPVPLSLPEVDARWAGPLTIEKVEEVASGYARSCRPISDVRASADYRRAMVKVFIRRAVQSLFPIR